MEEQKERTLDEVTNEHNQLCFRAGMLSYRMKVEQAELDQLFERIVQLNQEAATINQINAKAKEMIKKEETEEVKEVANG